MRHNRCLAWRDVSLDTKKCSKLGQPWGHRWRLNQRDGVDATEENAREEEARARRAEPRLGAGSASAIGSGASVAGSDAAGPQRRIRFSYGDGTGVDAAGSEQSDAGARAE